MGPELVPNVRGVNDKNVNLTLLCSRYCARHKPTPGDPGTGSDLGEKYELNSVKAVKPEPSPGEAPMSVLPS